MIIQLFKSILCYLNPIFQYRFDNTAYFESDLCPTGWWLKVPRIHYCLFNRNYSYKRNTEIDTSKINSKKKTIIIVTHEVTQTGAPILALDLIKRYKKKYNVVAISMGGGVLLENFRQLADIFIGPIPEGKYGGKIVNKIIESTICSLNPLFAIVNSIESSKMLQPLWGNNIPIIHLIHEYASCSRWPNRLKEAALFSEKLVFSSRVLYEDAVAMCKEICNCDPDIIPQGQIKPPIIIPDPNNTLYQVNSPDLHHSEYNKKEGDIIVLGIGTVQMRKGIDLFVTTARKVIDLHPTDNIKFIWIGHGYDPKHDMVYSCFIKDQINKLNLSESILILKSTDDLQQWYDRADIFFLSSRMDPLPLVAQDALMNEIPIVCFDKTGGIPEYLKTCVEASVGIVAYLDTEEAAKKISLLLVNKEMRLLTGKAGKLVAKRLFDQANYAECIDVIGNQAVQSLNQKKQDRKKIQQSGLFNAAFGYHWINDTTTMVKSYISSWCSDIDRRKPFPGFHPGIYKEDNKIIGKDPFAHYIENGMPKGKWLSHVILPSDLKSDIRAKSALHIHVYYVEMLEGIIDRVNVNNHKPDLFVSVVSESAKLSVEELLKKKWNGNFKLEVVPNKGRDIASFLTSFAKDLQEYEFIGHVHTKKSLEFDNSKVINLWVNFLFENMLGGKHAMIDSIINSLIIDKKCGIVFPDDPSDVGWTENYEEAKKLMKRMNLDDNLPKYINFPVGTMFWARSSALKPLFNLNLELKDYPNEPVGYDGTMLHAIERIIPIVSTFSGFNSAVTNVESVIR